MRYQIHDAGSIYSVDITDTIIEQAELALNKQDCSAEHANHIANLLDEVTWRLALVLFHTKMSSDNKVTFDKAAIYNLVKGKE